MADARRAATRETGDARPRRDEGHAALVADLDALVAEMRDMAARTASTPYAARVLYATAQWADRLAVLVQRHREPTGPR